MLNSALLIAVADQIESKPESHNQGLWLKGRTERLGEVEACTVADMFVYGIENSCGTTGCVAGWAAVLDPTPRFLKREHDGEDISVYAARALFGEAYYDDDVDDDDHQAPLFSRWLFDGSRRKDAMPAVLRYLAAGGDKKGAKAIEAAFQSQADGISRDARYDTVCRDLTNSRTERDEYRQQLVNLKAELAELAECFRIRSDELADVSNGITV